MMRLRRILTGLCVLLLFPAMQGEVLAGTGTTGKKPSPRPDNRPVNFGVKGGFTSSLFLVSDFNVNGVSVNEVQNNYKIGYSTALFMRINFDRHFIQPEVSYNINRDNITFEKPLPEGSPLGTFPEEASITSSIHSIDIPVLYGYNFIKEGPYSLAIFGGPKVRYIWNRKSDIDFQNFDQTGIHERLHPFNVSFTLGVSVTISPVFFDFRYDMGLHNISKHVTYDLPENNATANESANNKIRFHRRDHVLSFSFGVFF